MNDLELFPQQSHVDQYFGDWAVVYESLSTAVNQVDFSELLAHARESAGNASAPGSDCYRVSGGIAEFAIDGLMMKQVSSLTGGTSTVALRRQVRHAISNDAVSGAILRVSSPGGTVAGTADLGDDIALFARQKPIVAYVEDLGASAACWAASQATEVHAGRSALFGSIGTYSVVHDYSAQANEAGVKVHVVRAGEFKGAGEPGTAITDEQLAMWQDRINSLNDLFLQSVANGRGISVEAIRRLADGRVYIAAEALKLNLIDRVCSLDETRSHLLRLTENRSHEMAEESQPAKPIAATIDDILACCPGADDSFVCEQLKRKVTLDQAQSAWMEEQNARLEKAKRERDQIKQQAAAAKEKPGVEPVADVASSNSAFSNPQAEWNEAIEKKVQAGLSRQRAASIVAREQPDLRQAVIDAANSK